VNAIVMFILGLAFVLILTPQVNRQYQAARNNTTIAVLQNSAGYKVTALKIQIQVDFQ